MAIYTPLLIICDHCFNFYNSLPIQKKGVILYVNVFVTCFRFRVGGTSITAQLRFLLLLLVANEDVVVENLLFCTFSLQPGQARLLM